MLSIKNQNALRALARPKMINGNINPAFGQVNEPLNELLAKIMVEERSQFLTKEDLSNRVFVNEPASSVPMKAFLRPLIKLARKG